MSQKKLIQKAWIKTEVTSLSGEIIGPDTSYTRYDFSGTVLNFGFYPGWDDYQQNFSMQGKTLTIGLDKYKIEELTDTSLTISLKDFRRIAFLSEEYLSNQGTNLELIGEHNGNSLYRANKSISPRYLKGQSLMKVILSNVEGFNIKKATQVQLRFIVTEKGKIENVQLVKGVSDEYNKTIVKALGKTSGDWRPAYFRGNPVQTQMIFEIKYLDSIVP